MSRYIDADKLLEQLSKKKPEVAKARYTDGFNDAIMRVRSMISSSATADAVEVVRCKDCVKSECWYADKRRCFLWSEEGIAVFEDGFCSYGERKEQDNG